MKKLLLFLLVVFLFSCNFLFQTTINITNQTLNPNITVNGVTKSIPFCETRTWTFGSITKVEIKTKTNVKTYDVTPGGEYSYVVHYNF